MQVATPTDHSDSRFEIKCCNHPDFTVWNRDATIADVIEAWNDDYDYLMLEVDPEMMPSR